MALEDESPVIRDVAKFACGDVVYHKTGTSPGIITGITFRGSGGIFYEVTWRGRSQENHFDYELTKTKPVKEKTFEEDEE